MAKVSIIVPVFNSEEYIGECLNSLVNQSLEDIQVIVVDDCSTDNTLGIIKAYGEVFPNIIKIICNDKNYGQGYSRNVGMKHADGNYIGFVDSDDYVHPKMFEDMYNGAEQNDFPEVITTGLSFVKEDDHLNAILDSTTRRPGREMETLKSFNEIFFQSPACWNKIYRRDTLENMKFLEGRMWEDVAFTYTQLFNSNRILNFNNKDYFYRKRPDAGVSAKGFVVNPNLLDCFAVADELEKRTKESGRFEIFSDEIKLVQVSTCLQRASEVLKWNISHETKSRLCFYICKLISEKYGDWKDVDKGLLSSKVGIHDMDIFEKIELLYGDFKMSSYEGIINYELEALEASNSLVFQKSK